MSNGSGVETSKPIAVVRTESLEEEKEKVLSEFKNTFENMYFHYNEEQNQRRVPFPTQNIMNWVVEKSILELGRIYKGINNPESVKGAEKLILNFITGYEEHNIKEEAAIALAKWIKDSTELEELGILGKEQKSLLETAGDMFEVKLVDGVTRLVQKEPVLNDAKVSEL